MRKLLLSLVVVLSACGGGGGEPAAPAGSAAIAVSFYGDSTVEARISASSFVSEAQSILGSGYTLKNEGVSGTNSQQLLDGSDGKHPAWSAEMAGSNASVVFINHAINDHTYPLAQYRANLLSLVTISQSAGKRVVLQTPNPVDGTPTYVSDLALRVAAMRDVAQQMGAGLCDQFAAITSAGLSAETLDGTHPNPVMFSFMGKVSAECVRNAL